MSTYFPSPPESTEPPIVVEPERTEELEPEQLEAEIEPEPELDPEPEAEPEPEPVSHTEREPEAEPGRVSPGEPLEPAALVERTASYQWPSNTGRSNNGSKLDEVCSDAFVIGIIKLMGCNFIQLTIDKAE